MQRLLIKSFLVSIGGEPHTGWLPNNAVEPLPNSIRKMFFDFEIEEQGENEGFLLIYQSRNKEFCGDTWHKTNQEAVDSAYQWFGVPPGLWEEAK